MVVKHKVFGVGMIKTGTITLATALKTLGLDHLQGSYLTSNHLLPSYLSGNYAEIKRVVERHQSFDDFPFCAPGVAQILDRLYPGSKFILTYREPESWYESICKYFKLSETRGILRDSLETNPRLPLGQYYGLLSYALATFGTIDLFNNKRLVIANYVNYNRSIREHFADNPNFLEVCWMDGDGYPQLCDFLNLPLPNVPLPHANKRGHWRNEEQHGS